MKGAQEAPPFLGLEYHYDYGANKPSEDKRRRRRKRQSFDERWLTLGLLAFLPLLLEIVFPNLIRSILRRRRAILDRGLAASARQSEERKHDRWAENRMRDVLRQQDRWQGERYNKYR